ncbi:hypothetical protein Bca101_101852 [Brassica carinata]
MPLDVLGRTRATLMYSTSSHLGRQALSLNASCAPSLLAEGTSAWVSQIVVPILSRIWDGSWSHVCYRTRLAKIRAKGARSVSTCGGEFKPRNIVGRSGPEALDDPKSSTRPQSGEASSATDRAQVPWKGAPERVRAPSCPDPVAPRGAVYESGCLGMQPQSGGKFRPRLNMGERPMANKYREVKMKWTLDRESKRA